MASMLSPMYIAEIAPQGMRGRMVALNQLTIVLGQVIMHTQNYWLHETGPDACCFMFGLGIVPSLLFLIGVFFLPETPRWLVKAGSKEDAGKVLGRIGSTEYVSDTLKAIRETLHTGEKVSYKYLLNKSIFPIIMIRIGLAVFQQFCGINVV